MKADNVSPIPEKLSVEQAGVMPSEFSTKVLPRLPLPTSEVAQGLVR